ncbi:MAG: apolipoprotein N-acyltransferase, partial [Thermodesulfobacteriota bacterium]
ARGFGRAFFTGFMFGALFFIGMGHFLYYAVVYQYGRPAAVAVPFLILAGAVPFGGIFGAFGLLFRLTQSRRLLFFSLTAPALWVLAEYAKELVPILVPWADLGYAAMTMPVLAQPADLAGIYLVSFFLAAVNGFFAWWWISARREAKGPGAGAFLRAVLRVWRGNRAAVILCLALFALYPVYGAISSARWSPTAAPGVIRALLVQGNFSQKDRWSGMGFLPRVKSYLDLGQCLDPDGCVIVWPETVLNSTSELTPGFFSAVEEIIGRKSLLIAGGLAKDQKSTDVKNAAYFISGTGLVSVYEKNILLPWAEDEPIVDVLGDFYTAPTRFAAGQTPPCVPTSLGPAGISICLEILYPGYVRRASSLGAQFLVNLSNDTWFGDTTMPHQHLDAARMRAIENRRWLLRVSNSGISAVIAPDGSVTMRTGLFMQQAARGRFSLISYKTPYARAGNYFLFLCGLVLLASFVRVFREEST